MTTEINKINLEVPLKHEISNLAAFNGWLEYAKAVLVGGITYLSADWTVPAAPVSTTSTIYIFPGVVYQYNILQTVLQYMNSSWSISCWYATQTTGNHGNGISANTGDAIHSELVYDATTGQWTATATNKTQNTTATLTVTQGPMQLACLTLEGYNINTCDDLPTSIHFTNIVVQGNVPGWDPVGSTFTGCTLNVDIKSSTEINLNTGASCQIPTVVFDAT